MTGPISNIGSSIGASTNYNAPAIHGAVGAASPQPSSVASEFKSPKVVQDPVAGIITEYVNTSNGTVLSQSPSVIAIAYMRQGMSGSGLPRDAASIVEKTA